MINSIVTDTKLRVNTAGPNDTNASGEGPSLQSTQLPMGSRFPTPSAPRQTTHIPSTRPNRIAQRISLDENPTASYGSSIHRTKQDNCIRIFYQNIKGLSHTPSSEDYNYYLDHFRDLAVDIAGLAETNTAWQHQFLRQEFTNKARRAGSGLSKTSFGSPSTTVDLIPPNETFQAGGSITLCLGSWTTAILDPRSPIPPDWVGGLASRFGVKMTMSFMLSQHIAHARDPEERRP